MILRTKDLYPVILCGLVESVVYLYPAKLQEKIII